MIQLSATDVLVMREDSWAKRLSSCMLNPDSNLTCVNRGHNSNLCWSVLSILNDEQYYWHCLVNILVTVKDHKTNSWSGSAGIYVVFMWHNWLWWDLSGLPPSILTYWALEVAKAWHLFPLWHNLTLYYYSTVSSYLWQWSSTCRGKAE